jgi:hypothetical protein
MDAVDVLTFAVRVAQTVRSAADPEAVIAGAYQVIEEEPSNADEPMAVRIARLTEAAGDRRRELLDFIDAHAGPLPLNRPSAGWGKKKRRKPAKPDPEAQRLLDHVESDEGEATARDMMGNLPAFSVAERKVDSYFEGRTVIVRKGRRLTEEEAGKGRPGDTIEEEPLPPSVRGLIDYPFDVPILFTIETGAEPWSVWDVCCAFADMYARIYEDPEKYGVWGHDLTDLWIEGLYYFPEERVIYPHIGS